MPNTPTQNKVKFGLEKVAFAVATIDAENNTATYATPIMNPGARSISMEPQGELSKWYADNIAYYVVNNNNGYEGDLEVARFIDEIKAAIWNVAKAANGIQYEDANTEAVHFALLFEFKGDKQKVRHVFYNCVATRPAVSSSTTEDSKEPVTESSTITASPIHVTALDKDVIRGKCYPTDAAYNNWYNAVTLPTQGNNFNITVTGSLNDTAAAHADRQDNTEHISSVVENNGVITITLDTPVSELKNFDGLNGWGVHKWLGIGVNAGISPITGLKYNGSALTSGDIAEASSCGLSAGYFVRWVAADLVLAGDNTQKSKNNFTLGADGYADTQYTLRIVEPS